MELFRLGSTGSLNLYIFETCTTLEISFRKTKKAATVNWNYKSTSDVAKVDAWEIQDGKEIEYYKKTNGKILENFKVFTHLKKNFRSRFF